MYRKWGLMACAAIVVSTFVVSVNAFGSSGTTYLTFDSPVAIPGATLRAGTYIFERAPTDSRSDIVRVMSRDRSRVYLTQFTLPVERPAGFTDDRAVTFTESASGAPPAIAAWYPAGELMGYGFVYPK